MKILFSIILLCSCICGFSQSPDTLKKRMSSAYPIPYRLSAYILYSDKYGLQNFADMLRYSSEGYLLAIQHGDSISAAILTRQIGEAYYFKGNYDSAAVHYFKSISILEKSNKPDQLANSYNALAKLYRKTLDLKRSLQNYDKAFALFRDLNDSSGMAMILNESGVVFEYDKNYAEAEKRYAASLKIQQIRRDTGGIAYALSNLSGVYSLQKKYTLAEAQLKSALLLRKLLKDTFAIALNYTDLASTYFNADKISSAIVYSDSSNVIAQKIGFAELLKTNYELLESIYERKGDYQNAYKFIKMKYAISDSLFNMEKTRQIEELNTRYETVQREKQLFEIKALNNRKEADLRRKNILLYLSGFSVMLLVIIVAMIIRYSKVKSNIIASEHALKMQIAAAASNTKIQEEKFRISRELHDNIGSQLTFINSSLDQMRHQYSDDSSLAETQTVTLNTIKDLRNTVWLISSDSIKFDTFIIKLREYFRLLNRKGEFIQINATAVTDTVFNPQLATNVFRIIQEAVNNSVKHSKATVIKISLHVDEKQFIVSIKDNGVGFSDVGKQSGSGLNNMRQRAIDVAGICDILTNETGTEVFFSCTI